MCTGLCSLFGACFPRFLFYLILCDYCVKNRSFGDVVVYAMGFVYCGGTCGITI